MLFSEKKQSLQSSHLKANEEVPSGLEASFTGLAKGTATAYIPYGNSRHEIYVCFLKWVKNKGYACLQPSKWCLCHITPWVANASALHLSLLMCSGGSLPITYLWHTVNKWRICATICSFCPAIHQCLTNRKVMAQSIQWHQTWSVDWTKILLNQWRILVVGSIRKSNAN